MSECIDISFSEQYETYLNTRLYALSDYAVAEETGVLRLRRQPYLRLTGRGVVLGIADSGIDYTHSVFRNPDGRSRILAIWDQTAATVPNADISFGRVYTQEQLNAALTKENPREAVPVTDTDSHGTFLAGLAAGNEVPEKEFTGMAPEADILVVKLREAEECLKSFWFIAPETPAYEEADVTAAVDFMIRFCLERSLPLVLLLGISSNQGSHSGLGNLNGYLNLVSAQRGRAVVLSGGNEGNAAHHFRGRSYAGIPFQDAEVHISGVKEGLYIEFWGDVPDLYGIGFVSPTGETVEKLPLRSEYRETIPFVFEPTVIYVTYERAEAASGATFIRIRMRNPTDGVWKIRIFQEEVYGGRFDLWLPVSSFLQGEAQFLKPDPDTTITEPGNAAQCMTVTAYSIETGGLWIDSSRGFSRIGAVKPDFVAPGAGVQGPIRGGLYTVRSGSSIAAAVAAGLSLLMLQYDQGLTGAQVKSMFIRGAERGEENYPNTQLGWGKLNVYETLEKLRSR